MNKTLLSCLSLPAVALTAVHAQAQQSRTISGRVVDRETTQGLPGVTVLLKGTTNGISTNADGTYVLTVPATGGTLSFSSIGYINVERAINSDDQEINIGLAPDSKQLSQVVVTALGIERQRGTLGYAVETLTNRDITRASEPNLVRALQGRVAGVQISSASGAAGGATRIVIRGAQSFTGDNQPIYVVDGNVISNSALNTTLGTGGDLNNGVDITNRAGDIDPNIVESITVLKGPAAAALYGSRAASGAIIISTKKAQTLKKNQPRVTVNSAVTWERVNRLPKFQNSFGAGGVFTTGPRAGERVHGPESIQSWGPRMEGQLVQDWRTYRLRTSQGQPVDSAAFTAQPDNIRDFFETGVTYNNSVALSGANEVSGYYLAVADARTRSFVPENTYKRTTVSMSGTSRLFDKVGLSGTLNYIKSGGDRGIQGQSLAGIMQSLMATPRNVALSEAKDYNDPRFNLANYYNRVRNNPYFLLDQNRLTDNVDRVLSTAELSYEPMRGLSFVFRQGLDFYSDRRRQQTAEGTFGTTSGRYIEDIIYGRNTTTNLLVNYAKQFGQNLTLKAIAGLDYQQQAIERTTADAINLVVPNFFSLNNGTTVVPSPGAEKSRLLGVLTDIQLGYRNYLYLGLTARNDRSSTLPRSNRSFFYPSASLSFVVTEALGLVDNKWLSFAKLRVNAAQVGKPAQPYALNDVFIRSSIDDGFNGQYQFPLAGVGAYRVGNALGNPNLKSETTRAYEGGGEVRFLNDRIGIDATYYFTRSQDIIVNVPLSSTAGFTSQVVNAGTMENKGIELTLNAIPVRTASGFSWDFNINFTRNRNRVTEVSNSTSSISLGGLAAVGLDARVGQPYGSFYGSKMLRDPEGRVVVDPRTGFPRVDLARQPLGSIQPDYLAGLSTTVSYKGLALNVLFDTRQGGKFYSRTIVDGYFYGTLRETAATDRQPFVVPNSVIENPDGSFSPNTTKNADGGVAAWDGGRLYWQQVGNIGENTLFDASFVKLREASLTYSLPDRLITRTRLTGIQLALIGRNLALWTPKSQPHIDPEVSSFGTGNNQGFEYFAFPTTRSFGASLKLTL